MRQLERIVIALAMACCASSILLAQELEVPAKVTAGSELRLRTSGQDGGLLYIVGPGGALKWDVSLGSEITIPANQVEHAGRYVAILSANGRSSEHVFWVEPSEPKSLAFLARPSRVPVSMAGVVSGVAYVFDAYENLVTKPVPVQFELAVEGGGKLERTINSKSGVAWMQADSARTEGAAQFVATAGEAKERRVVQFVASEPCNLRVQASRVAEGIEIKTTPVRDCSGNPVPDGTIVTFTAITPKGRSSVDARIRKGIASTVLPLEEQALISVASGVVLGNEVRVGGAQ